MCLLLSKSYIQKREAETVPFDIVCYKVIIKYQNGHPLRRNKFGKFGGYDYHGTYYGHYTYKPHNIEPRFSAFVCDDRVFEGFHSFVHFDDAYHEYQQWLIIYGYDDTSAIPVIAKCIIPANTLYYKGVTDQEKQCYCSRELLIKEQVTFNPL